MTFKSRQHWHNHSPFPGATSWFAPCPSVPCPSSYNPPKARPALTKLHLCPRVDDPEDIIRGFIIFLVGCRLRGALGASFPQFGEHLPLGEQNLPFMSHPRPQHSLPELLPPLLGRVCTFPGLEQPLDHGSSGR